MIDTELYVRAMLNLSPAEIGQRMIDAELAQGYALVKEAMWWDRSEWTKRTIITRDDKWVRLVALEAKSPGNGALLRLVKAIESFGYVPVIVEPNAAMTAWCERRGYRSKRIGGKHPHTVWYPRERKTI